MATAVVKIVFAMAFTAFACASGSPKLALDLVVDNPNDRKRRLEEQERENCAFKRNRDLHPGPIETALEPIEVLRGILRDPGRDYMAILCHMPVWQFFILADRLKPLILAKTSTPTRWNPPNQDTQTVQTRSLSSAFFYSWMVDQRAIFPSERSFDRVGKI